MPDIAQKLKIQSGKNAGKHPSIATLYRAWPKPTRNTSEVLLGLGGGQSLV
jgi:hypothetical protein